MKKLLILCFYFCFSLSAKEALLEPIQTSNPLLKSSKSTAALGSVSLNTNLSDEIKTGSEVTLDIAEGHSYTFHVSKLEVSRFGNKVLYLQSNKKGWENLTSIITIGSKQVAVDLDIPSKNISGFGNKKRIDMFDAVDVSFKDDVVVMDSPNQQKLSINNKDLGEPKLMLGPSPQPHLLQQKPTVSNENTDIATIDMLVVATSALVDLLEGDIETLVDQQVAWTNLAFEDSGVYVRANVIEILTLDYPLTSNGEALFALTNGLNGLAAAKERRAEIGADTVMLLKQNLSGDTNSGIAFRPGSRDWTAHKSGYAVTSVYPGQSAERRFAHELVHNLGVMHNRDQPTEKRLEDYGHGYIVPQADREGIVTIMAYSEPLLAQKLIRRFSNSKRLCEGVVCGVDPSVPGAGADAAMAINKNRFFIAGHYDRNDESVLVSTALDDIADPALKSCIESEVAKLGETGEGKYVSDVRRLYCPRLGITSIAGLEQFTWLKSLELGGNDIVDLSPLSSLTKLYELWLYSNRIENVSPLAPLTELTLLYLQSNQISDVSVLSNFLNLQYLWVSKNNITTMPSLAGMQNLIELKVDFNKLASLDFAANNSTLTTLSASSNVLTTIGKVNWPNMWALYLSGNLLTSVTELADFSNIVYLDLASNPITQLNGLAQLSAITTLILTDTQLTSLDGFPNQSSLIQLYLNENSISDLSLLSSQLELTYLDLRDNEVSNLAPLLPLKKLKTIELADNPINDISTLASLPALDFVSLASENLNNLAPLFKAYGLGTLTLRSPTMPCWQKDYLASVVTTLRTFQHSSGVVCQNNEEQLDFDGDGLTNREELDLDLNPILNQNEQPAFGFLFNEFSFAEATFAEVAYGNELKLYSVWIERTGDVRNPASVELSVSELGATEFNDYRLVTAPLLEFGQGQAAKVATIQVYADFLPEFDESFIIELINPSVGTTNVNNAVTVHLEDGDSVFVSQGPAEFKSRFVTFSEAEGDVEVTVTREDASTPLSLGFSISQVTPLDELPITLNTPFILMEAGQLSANVSMTLRDDTVLNDSRKVMLNLYSPDPKYAVDFKYSTAVLTINDDELQEPGVVQFELSSVILTEGAGTRTIRLNRTDGMDGAFEVNVVVSDASSATENEDYRISSKTIFFDDQQTEATFDIEVINDTIDEQNEDVVLTITSTEEGFIGENNSIEIFIDDDDEPQIAGQIEFDLTNITINENAGIIATRLVRTNGQDGAFEISLGVSTSDSSATEDADFRLSSKVLSFADKQTEVAFEIEILEDTSDEPTETISLFITSTDQDVIGANNTMLISIADNDESTSSPNTDRTTTGSDSASGGGGATNILALLMLLCFTFIRMQNKKDTHF